GIANGVPSRASTFFFALESEEAYFATRKLEQRVIGEQEDASRVRNQFAAVVDYAETACRQQFFIGVLFFDRGPHGTQKIVQVLALEFRRVFVHRAEFLFYPYFALVVLQVANLVNCQPVLLLTAPNEGIATMCMNNFGLVVADAEQQDVVGTTILVPRGV